MEQCSLSAFVAGVRDPCVTVLTILIERYLKISLDHIRKKKCLLKHKIIKHVCIFFKKIIIGLYKGGIKTCKFLLKHSHIFIVRVSFQHPLVNVSISSTLRGKKKSCFYWEQVMSCLEHETVQLASVYTSFFFFWLVKAFAVRTARLTQTQK